MANEAPLPTATPAEEAEVRALLIAQGLLKEEGAAEPAQEAATDEPAAETEETVYDTPEEEAEARAMAGQETPAEEEPAAETEETAQAAAEETPAEEETPAAEAETKDPKGLAALAHRERQVLAREQRIRQSEARLDTLEAENVQLRNVINGLGKQLTEIPEEVFRAFGINISSDTAERIYYASLGDKAPPEAKKRMAQLASESKLARIERELAEKEQTKARLDQQEKAINTLEHMAQMVDENAYGHAADLAKADPKRFAREAFAEIQQAIRDGEASPRWRDEQLLQVAAERLEKRRSQELSEFIRLHPERVRKIISQAADAKAKTPVTTPATKVAGKPITPATPAKRSPAPQTITSKKTTGITRVKAAPKTHEDDIADVINRIAKGEHLKS